MPDVSITPTKLNAGTASADLPASGTAVNAAQTFDVDVEYNDDVMFLFEEVGGGAATITIDAGDNPPSAKSGKGAATITLAASDLKAYFPEKGRFVQSDGKITGSVATNNCRIRVCRIPAGVVGFVHTYNP